MRYVLKFGFQKGERIKTRVEIGNSLLSLHEIYLARLHENFTMKKWHPTYTRQRKAKRKLGNFLSIYCFILNINNIISGNIGYILQENLFVIYLYINVKRYIDYSQLFF